MNESLQQLHKLLLAQHAALADQLDDADDATLARAILTEMSEVLHRIALTQNLLFQKTSKSLENSLAKINDASDELTDALKTTKKAADIIAAVSGFLKFVDKAIDIAKKLAPLAI